MRIAIITALVLTIEIGVAAQHHYAFYYYLSNEQDLEINLLNTMIWTTDIVLTVHDAFGGEIWTAADEIGGNEAGFVRLSESIDANDYSWRSRNGRQRGTAGHRPRVLPERAVGLRRHSV